MKKLTTIALALTLLGSSAALAQYNGNQNYGNRGQTADQQRGNSQYQNRNGQNRGQSGYQTGGAQDGGRNDYQRGRDQSRNDVRGNPHWSRGDRLPSEYRNNRYVVNDWRNNHLRKPPRGYHWVQANNQYVLASLANGLIADIIIASNQNNNRRMR